jgi:tRNA-dihydrouridine synthase A
VQRGAFGACLMAEPKLVADCVKAMVDVVDVPVTVKHRIGIDKVESYEFVRDFVGTVSEAGCKVFIVHARNAWLKGPVAQGEPRGAAAALRAGAPAQARLSRLVIGINGGITVSAGGARAPAARSTA